MLEWVMGMNIARHTIGGKEAANISDEKCSKFLSCW